MTTTPQDLQDEVEATTRAVRKTAATARDLAQDAAVAVGARAAQRAADAGLRLRDAATDRLDSAREGLSDRGTDFGRTLRRAGLDAQPGTMRARALGAAADGVLDASRVLHDRRINELARDVQAMARRNPGLFMLAAVAAGYALARLFGRSARQPAPPERRAHVPARLR